MTKSPDPTKRRGFSPAKFLETADKGRVISTYLPGEALYTQGDDADSVFYLRRGKIKITVFSMHGKEAVIALLKADEFFGEGCLIGQPQRLSTAVAMTECDAMRVDKAEMLRVLHDQPTFSDMFVAHMLARSARVEEDLLPNDQNALKHFPQPARRAGLRWWRTYHRHFVEVAKPPTEASLRAL